MKNYLILISFLFITCTSKNNQNWIDSGDYSHKNLNIEKNWFGNKSGFEELKVNKTGIDFQNFISKEAIKNNRILTNGSGVAVGDYDNDGLLDIYFSKLEGPNQLYRNKGNFEFENVTEQAGVSLSDQYSTGVLFEDINGDEYSDLIVASINSGPKLLINNKDGTFDIDSTSLNINGKVFGTFSIAVADIENDGDLDIYLANYKKRSAKDIYPYERAFRHIVGKEGDQYFINNKFQDHYKILERDSVILWFEYGEEDILYTNNGDGTFNHTTTTDKSVFLNDSDDELLDWGLHARFFDYNSDNLPDLYVCNDFESPDRIWINQGNGTFKQVDDLLIRNTSLSSMSVAFTNLNDDNIPDIFVAEMLSKELSLRNQQIGTMIPLPLPIGTVDNRPQYLGNTFYISDDAGEYTNISDFSNLRSSEWSWASEFIDVDLDGREDLIITTGNYFDTQNADDNQKLQFKLSTGRLPARDVMFEYAPLKRKNKIFRRIDDKYKFEDVSEKWGFLEENISHGLASGDFDNDGDLDIITNNLESSSNIFKNISANSRISVYLQGNPGNKEATGSKVKISYLENTISTSQIRNITAGGSYASGSEKIASFGAPENTAIKIEIFWYDGSYSIYENMEANKAYKFDISKSIQKETKPESPKGIQDFTNSKELVNHSHKETFYNDLTKKQPLLPFRLSQEGPWADTIDFNLDTYPDVLIGNGIGNPLSLLINRNGRYFEKTTIPNSAFEIGEITGISTFVDNEIPQAIIAVSSYESNTEFTGSLLHLTFKDGKPFFKEIELKDIPNPEDITLADYDLDGDTDFFLAGRSIPNKYPLPANSLLYENKDGKFAVNTTNQQTFTQLGLVTAAKFADLDNDNFPELIVTRDLNTIKIFKNNKGNFLDITDKFPLNNKSGFWKGVAVSDLNQDGIQDLLFTNIGENTLYEDFKINNKELRFYYPKKDIDSELPMRIVESYFDKDKQCWSPIRKYSVLRNAFPVLSLKFRSYKQFSRACVETDFGLEMEFLSINYYNNLLLLSNGELYNYKESELPLELDFTQSNDPQILDYNKDGLNDVFISQNEFSFRLEIPRLDGGNGALLKNIGNGQLVLVSKLESGIKLYGNQKSSIVFDYNKDGADDILVLQNAFETILFTNKN